MVRKVGEGRYLVRWREGGRGTRQHKRLFDRKEDAEFFEASIRRSKQLGQLASELLGSEQRFDEFVVEWWQKYAIQVLKPGTIATYAYMVDRWITPQLGALKLREISRETIDQYRLNLTAAGAGAPTVNRTLGILQGILQRAVEWRRIAGNPVAGARRLPHRRSETIDARTPEEIERIRGVLDLQDAVLVSVLAYEALRPGEAFALRWSDVLGQDGKPRERLRVQRGLSGGEISSTKSARAREPELFPPVAKDLAELYLAKGRPPLGSLVFPNSRAGHLSRHNWRQRVWKPALAKLWPCPPCNGDGKIKKKPCEACAGWGTSNRFRPYDLRHTCATLLIYEGRPVVEVAQHLGHADPGFTLREYTHVFRDANARRHVPIADAISSARAGVTTAGTSGTLQA